MVVVETPSASHIAIFLLAQLGRNFSEVCLGASRGAAGGGIGRVSPLGNVGRITDVQINEIKQLNPLWVHFFQLAKLQGLDQGQPSEREGVMLSSVVTAAWMAQGAHDAFWAAEVLAKWVKSTCKVCTLDPQTPQVCATRLHFCMGFLAAVQYYQYTFSSLRFSQYFLVSGLPSCANTV